MSDPVLLLFAAVNGVIAAHIGPPYLFGSGALGRASWAAAALALAVVAILPAPPRLAWAVAAAATGAAAGYRVATLIVLPTVIDGHQISVATAVYVGYAVALGLVLRRGARLATFDRRGRSREARRARRAWRPPVPA